MGADNHAFVNLSAWVDESLASALGVQQAVGHGDAALRGHQYATRLGLDLSLHGLVGGENAALKSVAPAGAEKE